MVLRDAELERELDPMRVRPASVLGVVLVLCAVGWLAWRSFGAPGEPAQAAPVAASPAASGPRPMAFRRDTTRAAAVPASAPVVVPPGHVEVCGLGVVKEKDPSLDEQLKVRLARARDRVVTTLAARGDDASRATGLLLAMVEGDAGGEPGEARARWAAAAAPHRNELVRLAVSTRSAPAYAMALAACRWGAVQDQAAATAAAASGLPAPSPYPPPSSCSLLSTEQLARLDGGDGSVWLAVAADAQERRDRAAVADALHRFTTTQRMSPAWGALPRRVLDAAPPDVGPYEAFVLSNDLFGFEMGSASTLQVVTQTCTDAAVRDANRAQLCDGVARTLVERGSTLMDLAVGTAVGKRVGWPAERVATLEQERRALMQVSMQRLPKLMNSSCDGLRANAAYTRALGADGERAALREQLAQSGRSVADWAAPALPASAAAASGVAPVTR